MVAPPSAPLRAAATLAAGSGGGAELGEEHTSSRQVGGVEALREPVPDLEHEIYCRGTLAASRPEPRQAQGGTQLMRSRLLTTRDGQRF